MVDPYGDAALESAALRNFKRMALVGGMLSIAMGLVLLLFPESTLAVIAALIGVLLIVVGIFRIAEAFSSKGASGGHRALIGVMGLVFIVIGILCLNHLPTTVKLLAVLLGLAWIVSGIAEIAAGFTRRRTGWGKVGTILMGLLGVIAGLIILFWPAITLTVIVWITGLWLVALGVVQLILAFTSGRAAKNAAMTIP
ncbi:hypothetical protein Cs7R123_74330 [Catellatospora sp. TT07R-123]|uniref:HdeD family acid-resistance protein n=1 Tax=Catellatospora sp. TT07R-123 TaxID=2733863 RepID=UPI001B0115B7|nr:DUF308 domain-containing protein [Catellatospora sp. TT07R-123]GHJ50091.1 hypothetical protein Cs7R123_74330 [Catellatospora sp. TT07R-123]